FFVNQKPHPAISFGFKRVHAVHNPMTDFGATALKTRGDAQAGAPEFRGKRVRSGSRAGVREREVMLCISRKRREETALEEFPWSNPFGREASEETLLRALLSGLHTSTYRMVRANGLGRED